MATFTKLASGSWRVQVRRKGRYIGETFLRREEARVWALETEHSIDRGATPQPSRIARKTTFEGLVSRLPQAIERIERSALCSLRPLRIVAVRTTFMSGGTNNGQTVALDDT